MDIARQSRVFHKSAGLRIAFTMFLSLIAFTTLFLSYNTPVAHASPVVGFDAGRIIDDSVMVNTSTMTATQIQDFLNSKVPSCDTWGTQIATEYGSTLTHAQYAASQGWQAPPYTCLKDFTENNLSAAQIISNTAQQYQVNPEVLIVLLQKESGLVTDNWPTSAQYRTATGYGCPDSTPGVCDSTYYGFTSQVQWAATMYHAIMTNSPTWYTPYLVGNNTIQYSPDPTCGSSIVDVQNRATQALYNYTTYQPNQATLDAGWGTAPCGAYGNRNFYLYFTTWFGSTYGADYQWQLGSEEVFFDAAMTKPANIATLAPNTTYYFRVRGVNLGTKTWTNSGSNPVLLGTAGPDNRTSQFCNASWVNCGRPALLQESSVPTWGTGTFTFSGTTPAAYGTYNEHFNIVAEGLSWTNDIGMYFSLTVSPPTPTWQLSSQQIYSDPAHTIPTNTGALIPNTPYYAVVQARNYGNTTWTNTGPNPVRLGTSGPLDRTSQFYDPSWISQNRPALLQEASVAPGDVGTFAFIIRTPATYGASREYFRPVAEGLAWMNDIGMQWVFNVIPPTPLWGLVSQHVYTDSTATTTYDTTNTVNGGRAYIVLKAFNIGNTTWTNSGPNPVRLGTSGPLDRTSQFYDPSWISQNRPALLQEASVAPGQIGTFSFWIQAPYQLNGTTLREYFRPVVEGLAWMNDIGMQQQFTFSTPITYWQYISQGAYSDQALTSPVNLMTASINTKYYLTLTTRNTSGITWTNSGPNPVRLGTSNPQDRTSLFYDPSWIGQNRPALLQESSVAPGQTGTFTFTIDTPSTTTTSNEYFRPVIEGQTWLTDLGLYWAIKTQ